MAASHGVAHTIKPTEGSEFESELSFDLFNDLVHTWTE
jgi:hypothetical protein